MMGCKCMKGGLEKKQTIILYQAVPLTYLLLTFTINKHSIEKTKLL